MKKILAALLIFACIIQGTFQDVCKDDNPPTQFKVQKDICLPNICIQQFLELNENNVKIINPVAAYKEENKHVEASFEIVKSDVNGSPMDAIPTSDCFEIVLNDMDRSGGGAFDTYTAHENIDNDILTANEYNTVNFRFPLKKILEYCELTNGETKTYTCTHVIKYNIKDEGTEFYDVQFDYTIKMKEDIKAEVTSVKIIKTGNTNSEANGRTFTVPATLTKWNEAYDNEITNSDGEYKYKIGEKVYVSLKASQESIQQNYKFTFKSARFYRGDEISVSIEPVENIQKGENIDEAFELRLAFQTVLPGNLTLEVIGEIASKRVRFLSQSVNRVGRGQLDLVVTNDRVEDIEGGKKGAEKDQEESQDSMTVVILVLACIIGIMVPGAIVFSIIKYKKLMSQRKYEEDLYKNDKSIISEIQSQNTIIQGNEQSSNNKNNALSIHI